VVRRDASSGEAKGGLAAAGRLDAHRSFGSEIAIENLQVWPVVTDQPADVGPYFTLAEAQAKGVAVVREVEQGAQVNQLVVENRGDVPILVCAGTLVKGGQQDRQIGQDFILLARSTVPVDAFCVEPGRWTGQSRCFACTGSIAPAKVRASAQYEGDQGKVWEEAALIGRAALVSRDSSTLVAAFDSSDPEVGSGRKEMEKRVHAAFDEILDATPAIVGFAYAIEGRPVTVRAFADPRLLKAQLDPFVTSMALEAELAKRVRTGAAADAPPPRATLDDLLALVRAAGEGDEKTVTTEAGNVNRYRRGEKAASSACLLASRGKGDLALTEDWTACPSSRSEAQIEVMPDTGR
jgi:hypothetical protein